jgi:Mg2+/Co2+ transporter CorC
MLTIVNIDKIKISTLRVAGEKWELVSIQTANDVYQFIYKCIDAQTVGGLYREAIVNLGRKHTKVDLGVKVYELKCITNGKSRLVGIPDLKAPGLLIGPMLRVIEGC